MAGIWIQGRWVRSKNASSVLCSPHFLYTILIIPGHSVNQSRVQQLTSDGNILEEKKEKSDIHVSLVLQKKNCKKNLQQKFAESLKERVAARKIKKFFCWAAIFVASASQRKKSLWAGFAAWGHLLINLKTLFSELETRAWGKRAKPEKGDYQPLKSELWIN